MKVNRILPRQTAIYANSTVNLNVDKINIDPKILPAVYNRGHINAIPHLTLVRGFVRKGVFHIEQWIYNQETIKDCTVLN